ncbi:tyrosine-type recombinase/integrase [uncultured Psychroserpens sp.]|uniref:tyrosine-type recombinase/integrase n=1 Tax=uncultured Psychroserpens sp. TaxID=255436 RepID=UPI00261586F8|nr:tyrosine-type recombinase/integrase [uncultured Psychroserpens sp.]
MTNQIIAFIFHCKVEKKLSSKTIKAYETDLRQFKDFINFKDTKSIGKEELKSYFLYLSKFSKKTIKRKIATLKIFFSYLEFEEIIVNNPFRKVRIKIKDDLILPKILSIGEITEILKILYISKNDISNTKSYAYKEIIRNIAVIELLFASGIRVSELCSLRISNIDNNFSLIKIQGKGNKERTIPITNSATQNALKATHSNFKKSIRKQSYLFINRLGNPLSEQSVRLLVKRLAKEAKIDRNITPHVFRHSFATLLLEEDADIRYIQHLLGHSSIMVTQIYTHVNERKKTELLTSKNPRNLIFI